MPAQKDAEYWRAYRAKKKAAATPADEGVATPEPVEVTLTITFKPTFGELMEKHGFKRWWKDGEKSTFRPPSEGELP